MGLVGERRGLELFGPGRVAGAGSRARWPAGHLRAMALLLRLHDCCPGHLWGSHAGGLPPFPAGFCCAKTTESTFASKLLPGSLLALECTVNTVSSSE